MFTVSKPRIQVELEMNRSIPFAIVKQDPNGGIISKFCWLIGNEKFHCFHLTLYLITKVYKSDFHTSHFNKTSSFTEVLWVCSLDSWLFLHSAHFCYVILPISLILNIIDTDSQTCIDEIRLLLSSKLKSSTIFDINYLYLRFNMLVIRHF